MARRPRCRGAFSISLPLSLGALTAAPHPRPTHPPAVKKRIITKTSDYSGARSEVTLFPTDSTIDFSNIRLGKDNPIGKATQEAAQHLGGRAWRSMQLTFRMPADDFSPAVKPLPARHFAVISAELCRGATGSFCLSHDGGTEAEFYLGARERRRRRQAVVE